MAAPTTDGIVIQSYLPNLDDQDIEVLLDTARACGKKSRKYGGWIVALMTAELERRESEDGDIPADVDLPRFNGSRWTGAELANALQASFAARGATEDSPRVNDLLTKLDEVLRGWSAHRLRKLG